MNIFRYVGCTVAAFISDVALAFGKRAAKEKQYNAHRNDRRGHDSRKPVIEDEKPDKYKQNFGRLDNNIYDRRGKNVSQLVEIVCESYQNLSCRTVIEIIESQPLQTYKAVAAQFGDNSVPRFGHKV